MKQTKNIASAIIVVILVGLQLLSFSSLRLSSVGRWSQLFDQMLMQPSDDTLFAHQPGVKGNHSELYPQVTTSSYSGRRFLGFVVSAIGHDNRLPHFKQTWKAAWPDLHLYTQYSIINHWRLKGYGIFVANILGMQQALKHAEEEEEFDYLFIFEDDALPFANTTWPQDLDLRLDALEQKNGSALFLGGHGFQSHDLHALMEGKTISGTISRIFKSHGGYAWMVSRRILADLITFFSQVLAAKNDANSAPDNTFRDFIQSNNLTYYVTNPLLVDHAPIDGKSLTWGRRGPSRDWQGNPDWWTLRANQKNLECEKNNLTLPC